MTMIGYLVFKKFRQNQELTDKRCKVLQSFEILKFIFGVFWFSFSFYLCF